MIQQYCYECGKVVTWYFVRNEGIYEIYRDACGHYYSVAVR